MKMIYFKESDMAIYYAIDLDHGYMRKIIAESGRNDISEIDNFEYIKRFARSYLIEAQTNDYIQYQPISEADFFYVNQEVSEVIDKNSNTFFNLTFHKS